MQIKNFLVALAGFTLSVHAACPNSTFGTYKPVLVKFDDLKSGDAVPNAYPKGLLNWSGFTVFDPNSTFDYTQFKAASGKNTAYIDNLLGASVSYAPQASQAYPNLALSSFYYGCLQLDTRNGPIPCEIGVVAQPKLKFSWNQALGFSNISFTPEFKGDSRKSKLAKYEFEGEVPIGSFEFVGWRMPAATAIILDNIEVCYLETGSDGTN